MAAACSTAAFEESAAYLAQVTDWTPVSRLLGISWVAVGNIVERVVARRLDGARFDALKRATATVGELGRPPRPAGPRCRRSRRAPSQACALTSLRRRAHCSFAAGNVLAHRS